jgi:ankyrin repeat protein
MVKVQVTDDPSSIEAARATAAEAERATVDGVFERIRESRVWTTTAEWEALRRHCDEAVPRLLAIVKGRSGEDGPTRLGAADVLRHVDRLAAFRALLPLLSVEDAGLLAGVLSELKSSIWMEDSRDPDASSYALDESDAARLFALLDHPDPKIADEAASILGELMPIGAVERFRERLDHPIVGPAARLALAHEGRSADVLDRAIAAVSAREAPWDAQQLELIGRYTWPSPDPELVARAEAAILALEDSSRVPPEERRRVGDAVIRVRKRQEARANWPAERERAIGQVERLIAAGVLDADEAGAAIDGLRDAKCPGWLRGPDWGVQHAFASADRKVMFDTESCDVPPPHDDLVRELAGASRGAFVPEAVFQLRGTEEDAYPVQFVHRGRLYRVLIDYSGDWYQVDDVVAAVNAALEDAGEPRRFDRIETGDQCANVVFAHPDRLRSIAPEVGLEPYKVPDVEVVRVAALGDPASDRIRAAILGLAWQADPDATLPELARAANDDGDTLLHRVAGEGRADLIEALIAAGAKVEATNDHGVTPLHEAAEHGHAAAIEALIAAGANVDALDSSGGAPLHRAASDDRVDAITALLEKGAILRARDQRGFTPLHTAANDGAPAAAALLIDRGIPVDVRTRAMSPSPDTPEVKGVPIGELLAWAGWHIGGKVEAEQTPLHRAAFRGKREVAELLLDRGADVNAADALLQTPLHLAIAAARNDVAALLRARGADPERRDNQGRTPDQRAGDDQVQTREIQRGLRRVLWMIRVAQVVAFPFRVAGWATRLFRKIWPAREEPSSGG